MPDRDRKPRSRALSWRLVLAFATAILFAGAHGHFTGDRLTTNGDSSTLVTVLDSGNVSELPQDFDPRELITIRSGADIEEARARLTEFLFGRPNLPDELPILEPSFLEARDEERYEPFVASIEALIVEMDDELVSKALHFIPRKGNGQVVLLHEGHEMRFLQRDRAIRKLLAEGYAVVALFMPLHTPNPQPEITLLSGESIRLERHEQLGVLKPQKGHPVKYFVEPVIRIINHIEKRTEYSRILMLGISGGGWTTVLAAAIDPRIAVSVPVAGSYPMYLRVLKAADRGDWEQTLPDLYRVHGYLDLYALGSAGCGRRQVQIFIKYDTCCYAGTAATAYEDAVNEAVQATGEGRFDVVIDAHYRQHAISPC